MIAVAIIVGLLQSPLWAPGSQPKPSTDLKHSDALALLFKNLDDRITSKTCDSDGESSWKGRTVGELLASRLGADTPLGSERKFAMECWDGVFPSSPGSRRRIVGWSCTLYVERTAKDIGGGPFTFYLAKEPKRYLRNQVMCNEGSDDPASFKKK